jgi:ribosomal protein S18 acetylase RimI-like enzyme
MGGLEIEVAQAGPDRLQALANVFGRAFVTEPMMIWPMGEAGDLAARFTAVFSHFLEVALGLGIVHEVGAGQGAVVWVPPGGEKSWGDHPWNQARIAALAEDGGRRYTAFWDWVYSRTPDEPLWQLDSIAVDPAFQGRGLGRSLIEAGLARAGAEGRGAYLSTGTLRNVSIYGRSGFRVVEELDAPDGGPHIWFMRWDP